MRPVKAKFEDTKLFILKSVESRHALSQSLAAPLIAKAEETGTQFPSVAGNDNSGVSLRQDCFLGFARDPRSSSPTSTPFGSIRHCLGCFNSSSCPGDSAAYDSIYLMQPKINPVSGAESAGDSHCDRK